MLYLIFLCFIILGVEARSKELIDLRNDEKSSIELELNSIFINTFKDQINLEHEDKKKRVESISNCLGKKKF